MFILTLNEPCLQVDTLRGFTTDEFGMSVVKLLGNATETPELARAQMMSMTSQFNQLERRQLLDEMDLSNYSLSSSNSSFLRMQVRILATDTNWTTPWSYMLKGWIHALLAHVCIGAVRCRIVPVDIFKRLTGHKS